MNDKTLPLGEPTDWQMLYKRAFNCAAGLTNYVEDRPELRRIEREMAQIEAEARAALAAPLQEPKTEQPQEDSAEASKVDRPVFGGWVSCAERLPDEGQSVAFVVSCKNPNYDYLDGRVLGGIYRKEPFGGFSVPGMTIGASHWMPLPEPPNTQERSHTAAISASIVGANPDDEVMDMWMCESKRLLLHEGQLYRFRYDPECRSCCALKSEYDEGIAETLPVGALPARGIGSGEAGETPQAAGPEGQEQ